MTDYSRLIRRLEIDLYKAEHGMGMPYDRERVIALRQRIEQVRNDEARRQAELAAIISDGLKP